MRPRFSDSKPARRLSRALLLLSAAAVLTGLTGCVYRMNIQQGNFLEPRAVSQLQVGMTRSQVRYLLGTPMVPDAFDKDRWDYLYYLKKGRLKAPEQRHLVVYFQEDKVARFDSSGAGPMPPAEQRQIEQGPATPATPPAAAAAAPPSAS